MPSFQDLSVNVNAVSTTLKATGINNSGVASYVIPGKAVVPALDPSVQASVQQLPSGNSRARVTIKVPDYSATTAAGSAGFTLVELSVVINPNVPSAQRTFSKDLLAGLLAHADVQSVLFDGYAVH